MAGKRKESNGYNRNRGNHSANIDVIKRLEAEYEVHGLLQMLQYRRPHGSDTEAKFIQRYLSRDETWFTDSYGNIHKNIPHGSHSVERKPILWVSHVDTVHRHDGMQALEIVEIDKKPTVMVAQSELQSGKSNCLGADCTTGVWLMLQMIDAGVPGHYVFHRAEESGGRGSAFIADEYGESYFNSDNFSACVAFDRYGIDSVITEQCVGVTASNAFADSFAKQLQRLSGNQLHYARDPYGTFTDSANYAGLIGECTNISVGYEKQHSTLESQCLHHAKVLRDTLCAIASDYDAFITGISIVRDPGDYGDTYGAWRDAFYGARYYDDDDDDDDGSIVASRSNLSAKRDLVETILDHPDAVADILDSFGIDSYDILSKVYSVDS